MLLIKRRGGARRKWISSAKCKNCIHCSFVLWAGLNKEKGLCKWISLSYELWNWHIRYQNLLFLLISLNEKPAKNSYIQKFWKRSANTNAPPIDSYNQSNCSFYFRQQLVVFSANTLQNVKILIGVRKGFCFLFFFWLYSYTKLSIIKSVFEFPGMK